MDSRDDVHLVDVGDGTFAWHCEKCALDNTEPTSFLGEARCQHCDRISFVTQVLR